MKRTKIPEFPRYEVTEDGEIFNEDGHKLKPELTRNGYLRVSLSNDSVNHKRMLVHRLVATTFIPNPGNLPQVDHINEIKTDNRLENLQILTHSEHTSLHNKTKKSKIGVIKSGNIGESCDANPEISIEIKESMPS